MPALFGDNSRAKELLGHSKPQSAVTSWVDRICDPRRTLSETVINDFLIELIEAINLQATGPEEASRAIRKQLKHGCVSQQQQSLMVLEYLVLNAGERFRCSFGDSRLCESIKAIVGDSRTDKLVKRRLLIMLSEWEKCYNTNPKMAEVAGLYQSCGGKNKLRQLPPSEPDSSIIRTMITGIEKKYITQDAGLNSKSSKEIPKEKTKKSKKFTRPSSIDQRYRKDLILPSGGKTPKNVAEDKSRILQALATGSQCASNLVNHLQLVDPSRTNVKTDSKTQEHLDKIKTAQKTLVRYIGMAAECDSEGDYLGTLLNTNSQILSALQLYESFGQSEVLSRLTQSSNIEASSKSPTPMPESNLFDDPGNIIPSPESTEHASRHSDDLLGLDFSSPEQSNLPLPLTPDPVNLAQRVKRPDYISRTLSDYSDYGSSSGDSDRPQPVSPPIHSIPYYMYDPSSPPQKALSGDQACNPFADPVALS